MADPDPYPINPRALATLFVTECLSGHNRPDQLGTHPHFHLLEARDRALAHELLMGVLRRLPLLDQALDRHSRRPVRHLEPFLLSVLRVAAYQLLFLDRIPAYAAVDAAVTHSRRLGFRRQSGYVNALLRALVRHPTAAPANPTADAPPDRMALLGGHPPFLVSRWLRRHPPSAVAAWLARSNTPAPMFLTPQTRRLPLPDLLARLRHAGIPVHHPLPGLPTLQVDTAPSLIEPFIEQGYLFPQDLWSATIPYLIPDRPFTRILDLCAAPGGKLFSLSIRFPQSQILGSDVDAARLNVTRERARRLELSDYFLVRADAHRPPFCSGQFNLVLLDAPCSGSGTLQRNPDLRWRLTQEAVLRQARRQRDLITAAADLVAPGGVLAYITCSVEDEENQHVANDFHRKYGHHFDRLPVSPAADPYRTPDDCFQSFPDAPAGEGFFCALFERRT